MSGEKAQKFWDNISEYDFEIAKVMEEMERYEDMVKVSVEL